VLIEFISSLIKVTNINDARWKPEIKKKRICSIVNFITTKHTWPNLESNQSFEMRNNN